MSQHVWSADKTRLALGVLGSSGAPSALVNQCSGTTARRSRRTAGMMHANDPFNDPGVAAMTTHMPHPYGLADAEDFIARAATRDWDREPTFVIEHHNFGVVGGLGFKTGSPAMTGAACAAHTSKTKISAEWAGVHRAISVPLAPVTRGLSRSLTGTPQRSSGRTAARIAQIPKLTVRKWSTATG